ncbi:MAG: ATP-binding protein [Caldimonas sp.]
MTGNRVAPKRAVSLRRRLILLAAGAILPLALMAGLALQALLDQQRRQAEQSTLDLSRALASAVDSELRLTISALQTLAATEPMAEGKAADIEAFYRLAQRVLSQRPEWRVLLLAEPSGKLVFSTDFPLASAQPPIIEMDSFSAAVRTREPTVGTLARGPKGDVGVPVRIPIVRSGEVAYVLTAVVRPEAIVQVVMKQRPPTDWIVSIFDANNARVARSRDHENQLGGAPSASLLALQRRYVDEGTGETRTLEGKSVHTAFVKMKSVGWTVSMGVPTAILTDAWRQSAIAYGGGILLSLGLGIFAAWLVARSIARPIDRLRESALALGRGEAPSRVRAGLIEIEAASDALVTAAHQRERAAAEREGLLDAERAARAAAEQAQHRLELLAGAGALLSRSLEERTTLESIASVVVPGIADCCRIDLLDQLGLLQRKLTHHVDAERGRAIAELVERGRIGPDVSGSFTHVIATGETYLENFDGPESSTISDPTLLEFARATGMRASCVVPLVARGRTIGAMGALQAESGRDFSAEDGVLLEGLAQRAALALDNVRLFAEAQAALHEAELASRAKDEFLAMLGHELRNPLAPIVTSLEVMARRAPDAGAAQRRVIERQVEHLSGLVDDLLDVSRIAAGKIRLNVERVDMREVVERVLEATQALLHDRARPPEVSLPTQPAWVSGDALRLDQIVGNLLANAVKFSKPSDPIAVELTVADGNVRLVVADKGVGIAAPLLKQLFERFVQGEQALHRAEGGLGLGLAISRSLVELHHGTISAHSDGPGRGSRFVVTLPEATAQGTARDRDGKTGPLQRRRARLLLVDDNEDAVEALAELLRMEGYDVMTADSAERALERVDAFAPDAALLDIGLPKMNGYDLARALRAGTSTRDMQLIALTGYGRAPDRRRALEAGFDDHFVKPARLDELLSRLAALVSA